MICMGGGAGKPTASSEMGLAPGWQVLKAMGAQAVDEAFGIAGCMAAERYF